MASKVASPTLAGPSGPSASEPSGGSEQQHEEDGSDSSSEYSLVLSQDDDNDGGGEGDRVGLLAVDASSVAAAATVQPQQRQCLKEPISACQSTEKRNGCAKAVLSSSPPVPKQLLENSSPRSSLRTPVRSKRSPGMSLPEPMITERTENFGELFILRTMMEHYNGGESYNGVLVLPLRKFRLLCKDCGFVDDKNHISAGNVAVAYQAAVSHTLPAFGLRGIHKGKLTTLERVEELLWKPTKKFKKKGE